MSPQVFTVLLMLRFAALFRMHVKENFRIMLSSLSLMCYYCGELLYEVYCPRIRSLTFLTLQKNHFGCANAVPKKWWPCPALTPLETKALELQIFSIIPTTKFLRRSPGKIPQVITGSRLHSLIFLIFSEHQVKNRKAAKNTTVVCGVVQSGGIASIPR